MKNFTYSRAESAKGAISLLSRNTNPKFLGGGTNLVDLMREGLEQPDALIDVTRVPSAIAELPDGGISIGAAIRNSALANHPLIRERYPLLAQAVLFGASGQTVKIGTSRAESVAGVLAVITHENAPKMKAPPITDFEDLGRPPWFVRDTAERKSHVPNFPVDYFERGSQTYEGERITRAICQ